MVINMELRKLSANSQPSKYVICMNKDGITVEAPNKEDCIAIFNEVTKVKKVNPINEAIR
jgi:hypothetical protein